MEPNPEGRQEGVKDLQWSSTGFFTSPLSEEAAHLLFPLLSNPS